MQYIRDFSTTVDILHRLMDTQLLRQSVIADNIANSDTPNFKRSEVNFESELRRTLRDDNKHKLHAQRTHRHHIPFDSRVPYSSIRPRINLDYSTTAKNNGNNVDIEFESTALLNSRLSYALYANTVDSMFGHIRRVLR